MSTYNIKAPFSGTIWAYPPNGNYCYQTGVHACGCGVGGGSQSVCKPMDIGNGLNGTNIYFQATTNILSIKTTRLNACVCQTAPPGGFEFINNGVLVDIYWDLNANPGSYIASVFYAHLQNRIANGVYNSPNGRVLGQLGANCACNCSQGIHVHMAISGGGIMNGSLFCGQAAARGSTNIYTFVS